MAYMHPCASPGCYPFTVVHILPALTPWIMRRVSDLKNQLTEQCVVSDAKTQQTTELKVEFMPKMYIIVQISDKLGRRLSFYSDDGDNVSNHDDNSTDTNYCCNELLYKKATKETKAI